MLILMKLYLLRLFDSYLIILENIKLTFYFSFNKLIQKVINIHILTLILTHTIV